MNASCHAGIVGHDSFPLWTVPPRRKPRRSRNNAFNLRTVPPAKQRSLTHWTSFTVATIREFADKENIPLDQADMMDLAQIEGRVKASSTRKLVELVERHPDEAVNIMRSWMYQDA